MLSIVSLLIILAVSVVVTRVAAIALQHTGMSAAAAKFQARSAFTGVGYTTAEAEDIVRHPLRRRIVMTLMILGNAGIVSAVASLMLTFVGPESVFVRLSGLAAGLLALWVLVSSKLLERGLGRIIDWALTRFTNVDVRDYASLLRVSGDYLVHELQVREDDWTCGRTLSELSLRDEGVIVLGINRTDGSYVGAPGGQTCIEAGDVLIVYGREEAVCGLDLRRLGAGGDREHEEAVREQEHVRDEERVREEERERTRNADPPRARFTG